MTKNVIHTAQIAHYVRRSEEFGISIDNFRAKMPAVIDRKRRMVQGLVDIHLALYKQSGTELIMASGRFVGRKMLEVTLRDGTKRLLTAKNVVIGTGTHAAIEDIPGLYRGSRPMSLSSKNEVEKSLAGTHLLVAAGRVPNTKDIGLELTEWN